MRKLKPVIFLIAFLVISGMVTQAAFADTPDSRATAIVLVDRAAVTESDGSRDLIASLVGLIGTLQERVEFMFATVEAPNDILGPVASGVTEFQAVQDEFYSRLAPRAGLEGETIIGALANTYNLLGNDGAPPGSTVYLISGSSSQSDITEFASNLEPTLALYRDAGWPIVTLSLPGATLETKQVLDTVAIKSGGESFELGGPDGFKQIADRILRLSSNGALTQLGDGVLSASDVLISNLSVAPGTGEVTLLFFKQGQFGSLRLSNPSGFEASVGDRSASFVNETPHVVIWKLIDPVPGQWQVDVRGVEGAISAWQFAENRYTVALTSVGPVALNEPSVLVASINDGDEAVHLDGVKLTASVTTPNGTSVLYELNDDGVSGDSIAGDGYYGANITPVALEGDYQVAMDLAWPEFNHKISSQSQFSAIDFPLVEVTTLQSDDLLPGERAKVATVFVNVKGQPFAVSPDELTADLVSASGSGRLEISPQRILDDGNAWMFDVFFTPEQDGLHTLIFHLKLEYAGTPYAINTDSIVLSAATPALPVALVAAAPPPPVPQVAPPPPAPTPVSSSFPWWVLSFPGAAIIIALVALAYWLTRTRPYGYLYSDEEELVVDFGALDRHPVLRFLFKDSVRGRELGVPGLEDVSFRFSKDAIKLLSRDVSPTVRINNQPLMGETPLPDHTWIGTRGRLYNFLTAPLTSSLEPGLTAD